MATPGKLDINSRGRLTGDASISYNDPWPCPNCSQPPTGAMRGNVMHTMVGNLPGTIVVFNNPKVQASAFFGISQTGHIHQFIPVGKGYESWAQVAGNREWYSIECADDTDPTNPLTARQIVAFAQIHEFLARFAGFGLGETDSTSGKGLGVHYMGGAAWGGHTCPDVPPKRVRSKQRGAILTVCHAIRDGKAVTPAGPAAHRLDGTKSLRDFAVLHGVDIAEILYLSAVHADKHYGSKQTAYIDAGRFDDNAPAGTYFWAP